MNSKLSFIIGLSIGIVLGVVGLIIDIETSSCEIIDMNRVETIEVEYPYE